MNEFIRLRNKVLIEKNPENFSQVYLKEMVKRGASFKDEGERYLKLLNKIDRLAQKEEKSLETLLSLMSILGSDPYLDRKLVDGILNLCEKLPSESVKLVFQEALIKNQPSQEKRYHLIDCALELNLNIYSSSQIEELIKTNSRNYDLLSLIFQYMGQFKLDLGQEFLMNELIKDYPQNLKFQVLDLLDQFYSFHHLDLEKITNAISKHSSHVLLKDYLGFLKDKKHYQQKGVIVLQSMFYGDFEDSGKGNNGGLAILLKSLGNEVSLDKRIDLVMTLTISDRMNKPFMALYTDKHLFIRLPAYLDRTQKDPFLKRELFIKRSIKLFLEKIGMKPNLFHIRYLDNASNAVAKLSKDLDTKLILTLAPDPHRNMTGEEGVLSQYNFEETQLLMNKIELGDCLIDASNLVIGIGGQKVKKELNLYFPQFKNNENKNKVTMIAEGIKTDKDMFEDPKNVDVCDLNELIGIHPVFCHKPIILNVGRLAKIKGQINLFKAWSKSTLSESHNLLIVGGDLENPSDEEKEIIDFFDQALLDRPELNNRFFHKGALHNDKIKILEKSIMKKSFDLPHIYLASSLKEEFGIAILEAMSRGFLILAPIKGGVKSYIRHGENGFLIDTSGAVSIALDADEILYYSNFKAQDFKKIQDAGKKTIEDKFSIDKIASIFTDTYLSLLGGMENEV